MLDPWCVQLLLHELLHGIAYSHLVTANPQCPLLPERFACTACSSPGSKQAGQQKPAGQMHAALFDWPELTAKKGERRIKNSDPVGNPDPVYQPLHDAISYAVILKLPAQPSQS